jgi:cytochrome c oxidase subunit 2
MPASLRSISEYGLNAGDGIEDSVWPPPYGATALCDFCGETIRVIRNSIARLGGMFLGLATTSAIAAPQPWEWKFQPAATDMMRQITWFQDYTLWFIIPITVLVMVLLGWCMFRFNARRNPVPSQTTHNTLIEVIWTVLPVVVLLFIAIPSFQLLTAQYNPKEEPKLTVKVTGNQWNWDYEYETKDPLSFNSAILADADRAKLGKEDRNEYPRILTVDNELVVPVDTMVRVLVTGADVIHSFAMPPFGIKVDAVPGRINQTWFKAEKQGIFYGQCSELCGQDHAFMPIAIRVVTQEQFDNWYKAAKTDLPGANKALMAQVDNKNKVAAAD